MQERTLAPICPVCRQTLVVASTTTTLHRGRRSVDVVSEVLACPHGHSDPAAGPSVAYAIVTDAQSHAFDEAVERAWQTRYRATPDHVEVTAADVLNDPSCAI